MSELLRFRRPDSDPGADWAEKTLAPLRRRRAEVDVTAAVMHRIAERAPLPYGRPLPAAWWGAAWAASFAGGFLALGLLVAAAGLMVLNGDEGARSALALIAAAGRLAITGYNQLTAIAAAFVTASVALLKGAWLLIEVASPLVRGGTFLAALGGILSLGISLVIVSRARRTAPAVAPHGALSRHGGLA